MLAGHFLLKDALSSGSWTSNTPIEDLKIGPNSIDVSLSNKILIPKNQIAAVDPLNPPLDGLFDSILLSDLDDGFWLHPGKFILTSVQECFNCDRALAVESNYQSNRTSSSFDEELIKYVNFVQHYDGRSTLARLGLLSHISAGFGDYGFKGSFTLELVNHAPWSIKLTQGMRIGQVYFTEVKSPIEYVGYSQIDCDPAEPILGKDRF